MLFWRKKKNAKEQEEERQADRMLHHKSDPAIELPTEYEAEMEPELEKEVKGSAKQVVEEIDETPVPAHLPSEDIVEAEDLADHSSEGGWFSRMVEGLGKSTGKFTDGLTSIVTKKKLDQETLDGLEDLLLQADLGPKAASSVIERLSKDRFGKETSKEEIQEVLSNIMAEMLAPIAKPLDFSHSGEGPFVVLVCGVNGAGKTTTVGKMAHRLVSKDKKSVMIAAADTFRAAAIEQLDEWAKRAGASFFSKELGSDAASVAYEAYEKAKKEGKDVLFIDTAGRLQNKANLMAELEKIVRVIKKSNENLPHATLLVLDATTGQNAFSQVETFKNSVNISGLAVTKLDGSAKGGVLVGLADQCGVPVNLIGVGEDIDDLQPFRAQEYARSLVGL